MRSFIFFCCCAMLFGCNTHQQPNQQQQAIDTAKLFYPQNSHDGFNAVMTSKNAVIMTRDTFLLVIKDSESLVNGNKHLSEFLLKNAPVIRRKRFYIVTVDSNYNNVVDVINIVRSSGIDNYQVFDYKVPDFKPVPEPDSITVTIPSSVTETEPFDSTYLKIKIEKTAYKISLLNDSLSTNDIKKIDAFISINKNKIIEDKIIISGNTNAPHKRSDALLNVLKKHQIFRFKLLTGPDEPRTNAMY